MSLTSAGIECRHIRLAALGIIGLSLSCAGPAFDLDCSSVELRVVDTSCPTARVSWSIWAVSWEDAGTHVESVPWNKETELCDGEVEIWARRECADDGSVTVQIWVDGVLEKDKTAEGPEASARVESWIG
jgi:hypothetical protein